MTERIIKLLNTLISTDIKWNKVDSFVLHTVKDKEISYVQIEGLNRTHTVLFKIRVKQSDIGLKFKYPCIYEFTDILHERWNLKRINFENIRDNSYWNLLKFDDVFDIEYDYVDISELKQLLSFDECTQIEIRNNNCSNVYSKELLSSCLINECDDISLRIIHQDAPLRLNYKYGIFDVYCLIAPRFTSEEIFWLRVGEQE